MANHIETVTTTLSCDDTLIRALEFFAGANWKPSGQSNRSATFEGRTPIPWFLILCTFIGYLCFIIPGIILYIAVVRKMRKFQTLIVTVTPMGGTTNVTVSCPPAMKSLAKKFAKSLPNVSTVA